MKRQLVVTDSTARGLRVEKIVRTLYAQDSFKVVTCQPDLLLGCYGLKPLTDKVGFEPAWTLSLNHREIRALRKEAKLADEIRILSRPDAEGDLYYERASGVIRSLGVTEPPIYRIRLPEITTRAIRESWDEHDFDRRAADGAFVRLCVSTYAEKRLDRIAVERRLPRHVPFRCLPVLLAASEPAGEPEEKVNSHLSLLLHYAGIVHGLTVSETMKHLLRLYDNGWVRWPFADTPEPSFQFKAMREVKAFGLQPVQAQSDPFTTTDSVLIHGTLPALEFDLYRKLWSLSLAQFVKPSDRSHFDLNRYPSAVQSDQHELFDRLQHTKRQAYKECAREYHPFVEAAERRKLIQGRTLTEAGRAYLSFVHNQIGERWLQQDRLDRVVRQVQAARTSIRQAAVMRACLALKGVGSSVAQDPNG